MKINCKFILLISALAVFYSCKTSTNSEQANSFNGNIYEFQNAETRWSSFENITAARGKGGAENKGAKSHAYDEIKAGHG
jgi:hypothetical protein